MDALSELLRAVKLSGAMFFNAEGSKPWCVEAVPSTTLGRYVASNATCVVEFHLVTQGTGYIRVGEETTPFSAGDLLMVPHGDPHVMGNGLGAPPESDSDDMAEVLSGGLKLLRFGGGGETTRFICGYFGCERHADRLFLVGLPRMIKINLRGDPAGRWLESSVCHLVSESETGRPGQHILLSKMAEALFIESLRRYMAGLPPDEGGWLAGARDPVVGAVLTAFHRKPEHHWTLDELAVEGAASRSVVAERFTRFIGEPPLTYLARWRLQLGARLLQATRRTVLDVAASVGYESEAAFNRAFKREFGVPPGQFRKTASGRASPTRR